MVAGARRPVVEPVKKAVRRGSGGAARGQWRMAAGRGW